jgi:hypothetical protein
MDNPSAPPRSRFEILSVYDTIATISSPLLLDCSVPTLEDEIEGDDGRAAS